MTVTGILKICFISISLICLVLSMIFRFNRRRQVSDTLELVSFGFLIAFTAQFVDWTNASSYTNLHSISLLILFILSVVLAVYKIIMMIKGR